MSKGVKRVLPVFLAVLLAAGSVFAGEQYIQGGVSRAAGNLKISPGTEINGDLDLNMGEIEVYGVVNGDVKNNMGRVVVYGDVNGNVETDMGQVEVGGNITGDLRASMGEVVVGGKVGGNLQANLGDVHINGIVGGDVRCAVGEIFIPGAVGGNVIATKGKIFVTGTVKGDIDLSCGRVVLGPRSRVDGRVRVEEGAVEVREGAAVTSVFVEKELSEDEIEALFRESGGVFKRNFRRPLFRFGKYWKNLKPPFLSWPGPAVFAGNILNALLLLALSLITGALFPRHVQVVEEALAGKPGPAFGWGLLGLVLVLPLAILLFISIIGIPLILVEFLLLAVAGILGATALARFIGSKIINRALEKEANLLGEIALGALVIGLLGLLPVFGGLLFCLLFIFTLGASLLTRFGTKPLQTGFPPSVDPEEGAARS